MTSKAQERGNAPHGKRQLEEVEWIGDGRWNKQWSDHSEFTGSETMSVGPSMIHPSTDSEWKNCTRCLGMAEKGSVEKMTIPKM